MKTVFLDGPCSITCSIDLQFKFGSAVSFLLYNLIMLTFYNSTIARKDCNRLVTAD